MQESKLCKHCFNPVGKYVYKRGKEKGRVKFLRTCGSRACISKRIKRPKLPKNIKCKVCEKSVGIFQCSNGEIRYLKTCGSSECRSYLYSIRKQNFGESFCQKCGAGYIKSGRSQRWCKVCVPDKFAYQFIYRYGLSYSEYVSLKEKNKLCPICMERKPRVVDHCHSTNKVRGFICDLCNTSLYVVENTSLLKRALEYLGKD